ncbi:MAG: 4Fe-4S binding protein [Treponema sp.]|nr:4Fe-4S binding protein [Treponema sp.]
MRRKKIVIDSEKCMGCGLCAAACHEAAIGVVDGKARLLREDYCDGLGNCLPVCPVSAIRFEGIEGGEDAVKETPEPSGASSCLRQWPVQIKLVMPGAPFFSGAHLLVAADCAAYACGEFHARFMKDRITIIGCPKLDATDYTEKLTEIIAANDIQSVTVARMEVPCCHGIEQAAVTAVKNSCKAIPCRVAVLTTEGAVTDASTPARRQDPSAHRHSGKRPRPRR